MLDKSVFQGFWSEINGATLQDLMYKTSSTYEAMSTAISMRGAGSLAGSVLGVYFLSEMLVC